MLLVKRRGGSAAKLRRCATTGDNPEFANNLAVCNFIQLGLLMTLGLSTWLNVCLREGEGETERGKCE